MAHQEQLCTTCQSLNLTPKRFIIDKKVSTASGPDASSTYLQRRNKNFALNSLSKKKTLGTLDEILQKSTGSGSYCPFCCLIVKSAFDPASNTVSLALSSSSSHDIPERLKEATCYLTWEVDGREAARDSDGRTYGRTRRIHLKWSDDYIKDSYLVFVAPENFVRPNSDAQFLWKDDALFLGRDIPTDGSRRALIKSWMDLCHSTHKGPCAQSSANHEEFEDMVSQSYFGVIDVLDLKLTSLPFLDSHDGSTGTGTSAVEYTTLTCSRLRAPYVALSYVWGLGEKAYTTTRKNVMLCRQHGGLEKSIADLPRALQDSIELVKGLGIRYLWIDSLCIVQDSPRSWNLNSRAMDLIYGNSILTICAADGFDASAGLQAMHANEYDQTQLKANCAPGVRLMVSRPPETSIKQSIWASRAWTFQERLLSKRCLIFTEGRVYFQCLSTGMSEEIYADRAGAGWSLDLVNAPLQMLRALNDRPIWVYMSCVPLYTARRLTKTRDILAAFSGISNRLFKAMQAPLIFGLPSSHFDLALLWEPCGKQKRRTPTIKDAKTEFDGLEFPSWSWCGWVDQTIEYKPGMVQGCISNLNEWLLKHTWICWYIRDGSGRLRPFWDSERVTNYSRPEATESRWRGYSRNEPSRSKSPEPAIVIRRRESPDDNQSEYRDQERYRGRQMNFVDRDRSTSTSRDSREQYSSPPPRNYMDFEGHDRYQTATNTGGYDCNLYQTPNDYGRQNLKSFRRKKQKQFSLTLPENPYRVVMTDYTSTPSKEFPDQPILQFWTWHCTLHLVIPDDDDDQDSSSARRTPSGLVRCDIADDMGDWCGTIVIDGDWILRDQQRAENAGFVKHDFIAISEARNLTDEECEVWTYYVPKERDQSEWDLYYVMLLERDEYQWRRVAVGKVFKGAFTKKEWKEIVLG